MTPTMSIARFTRLQFALAVVIFFVTEVPVIGMTFPLFIAALVFVRTKYLPKKYDARTSELIDPLIDLAPIDKTPSTADLLEEGTPPSSPAPLGGVESRPEPGRVRVRDRDARARICFSYSSSVCLSQSLLGSGSG